MAFSRLGLKSALAVAALAALTLEPGAAAAAAQTATALSGTLVMLHADDFAQGQESETYGVQRADGSVVEADMSKVRGADAMVGRRVNLVGDAAGSEFVATSSLNTGVSMETAAASGDQQTVVILFNFTNDTSQPWSAASVSRTVFGATGSVAAYYREVSNGAATLTGPVIDWLKIPYDNTGCRYSTWSSAAIAASGVDLSKYRHVVFAFPHTTCSWAGLSTVGGRYSWINGAMTIRTVGHELAHEMGVHHASALACTSNGVRVTYSSTCSRYEYGDPFSIMGAGTRHLTNLQLAQIGWLTQTQTVTSSGYYSLAPAEETSQPRLLRVARGDGTYLYLEFRQDYGDFDVFPLNAPATRGVSIRIAPDTQYRVQSQLLDMTPTTVQFEDAALTVGRSFTDPVSHVTITTTAASSGGAIVAVSWPGSSVVAPTSTPTATPTPTPTPSVTPRPTPTATATPTPSATATPTAKPTSTVTPSPTTTASPSPTPTSSPAQLTTVSVPTNLHATRTWGRRVKVTWTASTGPVAGYSVWCNGTWIGRTTSLKFIDYVPAGVAKATYIVRAYDIYRNRGPRAWYTLRMF